VNTGAASKAQPATTSSPTHEEYAMSTVDTLRNMLATKPLCDLGYRDCEGEAFTYDTHPTGVALGEDGWSRVWYCGNCGWEAARDS
jgi:hypothetical protein